MGMEHTYPHDCDTCDFLGTIMPENGVIYDVYVCPVHNDVIARFGPEADYLAIDREHLPVAAGLTHNDPSTIVVSGYAVVWRAVAALLMEKEQD